MILFNEFIRRHNIKDRLEKVYIAKKYIVRLSEHRQFSADPARTRIHLHNGSVVIVDLDMRRAAERIRAAV